MWAAPLGAALAVAVLSAAVPAVADTQIQSFFAQRFDVDDEGDFGSATDLGVTFSALTPRTTWSLTPGVRLLASTNDDDDVELRPTLAGGFRTRAEQSTLFGSVSVTARQTRFTETAAEAGLGGVDFGGEDGESDAGAGLDPGADLDSGGETGGEDSDPVSEQARRGSTLETVGRARLGYDLALGPIDGVFTSGFVNVRDFDDTDENLTSFVEFGADAGYRRRLDPRTGASISAGASWVDFDNETEDTLTGRVRLNATRALRPDLNAQAGIGFSVTNRDDEDAVFGVLGNLGVRQNGPDWFWSADLVQDVRPSGDAGDVESVSRFNVATGYRFDPRNSVNLSGSLGFETPVFDDDDDDDDFFASVSLVSGHQLSRDWRMSVGYRFRSGDDDDIISDAAHSLFVRFSHDFRLLP